MKRFFVWAVLCMACVGTLCSCGSDDDENGWEDVNIPDMKMSELAGVWKGTIAENGVKHSYTITLNGKGGVEMIEKYGDTEENGTGTAYLSTLEDGCHMLYMSLKIPFDGGIASSTSAYHIKWAKADRSAILVGHSEVFKKQ